MNLKLYFKLVFYITGTFIAGLMLVIMTLNFFRDARVLQKPSFAVENGETKTLKYKKPSSTEEKPKKEPAREAAKEPEKKNEPVENNVKSNEKLRIEVLNYSGMDELTSEVVSTLNAMGYEASGRNERTDLEITTLIIERNDKGAGAEVQKAIKAGKVVKWPDAASSFDMTVKIGSDFRP